MIERKELLRVAREQGIGLASDYPKASIKVETLESILAGKLRAMTQRTKCRDYYDVWRMKDEKIDFKEMKEILKRKCSAKKIDFDKDLIFPDDLIEILTPYWERELSRVLYPVPKIEEVIDELKSFLSSFLPHFPLSLA